MINLFLQYCGGNLHQFEILFVIGCEDNRDCDITMPLSLKTMELQIKRDQKKRGIERCRSTDAAC